MKKMVMVAAALFALCLTTAMAMDELPRKPVDQQSDLGNYCDRGGCGWLSVFNEDWAGVNFDFNQLPNIAVSNDSGLSLRAGAQSSVRLPAGRYTLQGSNGRSMTVDIRPHHTKSLHFYGMRDGDRYATGVIDDAGTAALLTNFASRFDTQLPPAPPPPLGPVHYDGWHDAGAPWSDNGPWHNEPPHRYGPPIQERPPEPVFHRGPGLQMPPPEQHPYYVPHVRY